MLLSLAHFLSALRSLSSPFLLRPSPSALAPNPTPCHRPPTLPPELIHQIIGFVANDTGGRTTKARLCRLSKSFSGPAQAALYRTVSADFDHQGPKRTKQNATPISDTLLTNPALSTLVRTLRIKVDVAREVAPPTDDSRGSRSGQDDELLGALVALNLRIEEFVVARAQEGCFNLLSSIPGLQRLEFVGEEFGSSEWRLAPTPPESFPFQLTALITPLRFNYGAFQSLLSNSATSLIHLTADICLLIQLCNPDQQSFDRRLPPLPSLSSLTLIVNDFDVTHDTTNLIAFLAILPSLHTLRLAIHEHVPDKESVNLHLLTGLPSSVVHVDLSRVYIDKVALLKYLKKPGMGLKRLSLYPEHFERAGESEAIGQTCEEKGVWIRWC